MPTNKGPRPEDISTKPPMNSLVDQLEIPVDQGAAWAERLMKDYEIVHPEVVHSPKGIAGQNREAVISLLTTLQTHEGGNVLFELLKKHGPKTTVNILMGIVAVHARAATHREVPDEVNPNAIVPLELSEVSTQLAGERATRMRDNLLEDIYLVKRAIQVLQDAATDGKGILNFNGVLDRLEALKDNRNLSDAIMIQDEVRHLLRKAETQHKDRKLPEAIDGGATSEAAPEIAELLNGIALDIIREAHSYEAQHAVTQTRSQSIQPLLEEMPHMDTDIETLLRSERDQLKTADLVGHSFSENIEQRSEQVLEASKRLALVIGRELLALSQAFETFAFKLDDIVGRIDRIAQSDTSTSEKSRALLELANSPALTEDALAYDDLDKKAYRIVRHSLQRIATALIELSWLENAAQDVAPSKQPERDTNRL